MKDNTVDINNSSIYGNINNIDNSIDNSVNITNHFNQRINLKERFEKGNIEHEYSAYCVGKFGNKAYKGCVPITFINIHSYNQFMYDHMHINVPKDWYSELYFNDSIMKFKGTVLPYTRGNGTLDYSIKITEIYTDQTSKRTQINYSNSLKFRNIILKEEHINELKNYIINGMLQETLAEFTIRILTLLDSALASIDNSFYSGFITNFILTQYFLNTSLNEQCNQIYIIRQLDKEILLDLALIISNVIMTYNIDSNKLYKYKDLFSYICNICNVLQNINKNCGKYTKGKNSEFIELNSNLNLFGNKINHDNTNKMFDKIKRRHKDFGFSFPENKEEFENELYVNLIKLLCNLGYINVKNL